MLRRIRPLARSPLLALALVSVLSLAARAYRLDEPCQSPCTTAVDHTLIFDEAYYVNAARVIDHIRPAKGSHYDSSPLGTDPNAEHPQGAKLLIAAAIKLFGDGPFAWRIGSLIFGSIAILGMYALARFAGGGAWTGVGAATLMACDNLLLVHGRIGTLDIYAVAMMIWGVAVYTRGSPWWAALWLGIADCFKEVAPYALIVLGLLELARVALARRALRRGEPVPADWGGWRALRRLAIGAVGSLAIFVLGLWIMGVIATPYADSQRLLVTGGPFAHLRHMIKYASALTSPHGATGIASYPWQWLFDLKPITYLRINPSLPGQGLNAIHPVCAFFGMASPPMIAFALPALALCAGRAIRFRSSPFRFHVGLGDPHAAGAAEATGAARADDASARVAVAAPGTESPAIPVPPDLRSLEVGILAVAWSLGTWAPYELQSALDSRTSYLYYMVVVMPGVYLALAEAARLGWTWRAPWMRSRRGAIVVWAGTVLAAVVLMYPFVAAF